MKEIIFIGIVSFLLSGCGVTPVKYDSPEDKTIKSHTQKVNNKQCMYLIGPVAITKENSIKTLLKATIDRAHDDGLFGNKLANIKIEEGGYTTPIFSKLCLYIDANLVYDKFLDE